MRNVNTLLVALVACGVGALAQPQPDFSGVWQIDTARSVPLVDVWGQTRPTSLTIRQTPTTVEIVTDDGGIPAPREAHAYAFDGDRLVRDDSLGTLPNFERLVRTAARWEGPVLRVESESLSVSTWRDGSERRAHGITTVWRLSLSADGRALFLERSGYRAEPPAVLHGSPYDRADDLVYNIDRATYRRD